ALIAEALDREEEKALWYARSAIADVRCATKDNASLCCLAQAMLHRQEINRAFRYITISLNDALFYNAKLRPWQIANIIPMVEKSYLEVRAQQEKSVRNYLIVISVLTSVLLGICIFMLRLYRRSQISQRKIETMNRQIQEYNASLSAVNEHTREMNKALVESNAVKEEYIALFLSMCSNYIEKLTAYQRNVRNKLSKGRIAELQAESSSSSLMDAELNNFYEMFDNAFLQLYPDFVEEFNSLLIPTARIELKKGERLNTELRIFALIRLGITDSSRIASLLRYSVNTIYNYRARIKNNAAGSRDDFEKRIRTIGAMRPPEQP
ncbi:MAG: transcriptional regulator, partial [Alistipes sp.]|nr:transcriptional regulator [Alistipes sp.]